MENDRYEILDYLMQLLEAKRLSLFKEEINKANAADIAEFLEKLDSKTLLLVYRLLNKELAVDVFAHLSPETQSSLSMFVSEVELKEIMDDLFFDDKIDFLEEMPANLVKKILKKSSEKERSLINQFLKYPDNSAGSLMTIELVDFKKEMTVEDALKKIRTTALDKETVYTCYAINSQRVLEGIVSLKDLVLSDPDKKIEDIMKTDIIYANTNEDQEEIAEIFKKYDLLAIPVVDSEKRLVGIITIDDIVDVIEEEHTEDIHRMAALEPMEKDYLSTDVINLAKKRILWMLVLMISATLTSYIMYKYESITATITTLGAFVPMLMNTGGNAGSQASTLSIRSIVLNETEFNDIFRVFWKELRVGLIVGIALATINFIRIYILDRGFLQDQVIQVGLTVSAAMLLTIMIAKIIGGILPLFADKIGLDPALMATPLISTIVDALSLIIYFTIASMIFAIT